MNRQIGRGCIGLTCLGLGIPYDTGDYFKVGSPQPRLTHCFDTLAEAEKLRDNWNAKSVCCSGTKQQQNIYGNTAVARVFMMQFNNTVQSSVNGTVTIGQTKFTKGAEGRYNLEDDPAMARNRALTEDDTVWSHFRKGNFDFAIQLPGDSDWLNATGAGANSTAKKNNLDALLKQFHALRDNPTDRYNFNCAFFCVACDTPWAAGKPQPPIVPK